MDTLVTFDLDAARNTDGRPKQSAKRRKYTARACHQCKRRKVKCSGEDACQQCRTKDVQCRYSPQPPAQGNRNADGHFESEQPAEAGAGDSSYTHQPTRANMISNTRFDRLCDRVNALERTLAHVVEVAKVNNDGSPTSSFQPILRLHGAGNDEDDEDANQFAAQATTPHDLTLSSQVAAMSALLSRPPSPSNHSHQPNNKVETLIEFPDPSSLQHLLDVYFHDFDAYFPFLDRQDTVSRIYSAIRRLGYSSYNRIVVVTVEHLSTVALASSMLAMAECVDSNNGARDGERKRGGEKHLQSYRAIQRLSHSKTLDLDTVRAQTLVAAYLMHCEALNAASQAISIAWQLAMAIRLNNKKTWPRNDTRAALQRQRLWWTIYFLDRQISRRSGIAYHIRDTEFDVDEFMLDRDVPGNSAVPHNDFSHHSRSYIQVLINLGKLWGQLWDTFFAIGATRKGDWIEVEIMDARILNIHRQMPTELTWDSKQFVNYSLLGEEETHTRRRLQIYTRLSLLRMLIRQNPVRQAVFNTETAYICSRLAREVIAAHDLFISHYPDARATGYFTSSSIVECIYHLAPVLHESKDGEEYRYCVTAVQQAHCILVKISAYNNVAKNALKALSGFFRKWGSSGGVGNSGYDTTVTHQDRMIDGSAIHDPQGLDLQLGPEDFGDGLGGWVGMTLGSFFGNEVGYRPGNEC